MVWGLTNIYLKQKKQTAESKFKTEITAQLYLVSAVAAVFRTGIPLPPLGNRNAWHWKTLHLEDWELFGLQTPFNSQWLQASCRCKKRNQNLHASTIMCRKIKRMTMCTNKHMKVHKWARARSTEILVRDKHKINKLNNNCLWRYFFKVQGL